MRIKPAHPFGIFSQAGGDKQLRRQIVHKRARSTDSKFFLLPSTTAFKGPD